MPLLNRDIMPPGGFPYREPAINWSAPNPYLPIEMIAGQLQMARAQNPAAGLNPGKEACLAAVEEFTCARLRYSPKWCVVEAAILETRERNAKVKQKCGSCGKKRKR